MATSLFSFSSLLMAFLFASSASVQFNDPDWYFWLPLYSIAAIVNLVNAVFTDKITKRVPRFGLFLGIFLFIKVVIEDLVYRVAGFTSFDLTNRVVREKFGSSLVIMSMFLHLQTSSKIKPVNHVQYGMAALVVVSYGISFMFFKFYKSEMKF